MNVMAGVTWESLARGQLSGGLKSRLVHGPCRREREMHFYSLILFMFPAE